MDLATYIDYWNNYLLSAQAIAREYIGRTVINEYTLNKIQDELTTLHIEHVQKTNCDLPYIQIFKDIKLEKIAPSSCYYLGILRS